jgi:hypothetical protein
MGRDEWNGNPAHGTGRISGWRLALEVVNSWTSFLTKASCLGEWALGVMMKRGMDYSDGGVEDVLHSLSRWIGRQSQESLLGPAAESADVARASYQVLAAA